MTVLYARFAPLEFSITLEGCGGTFNTPQGEKTAHTFVLKYDDVFELPICTRAGHAFLGWFDADGNEVKSITSLNIKDETLTAKWLRTGVEYRIDYILGGGAIKNPNPDTALSDVSVPLNEPIREGFLFLGWYDNAEGLGEPYSCTPFGREQDLTLYALWQEIKVSGSVEYFDYEKTSREVTITDYHGPLGSDVDVIIPSVVDG